MTMTDCVSCARLLLTFRLQLCVRSLPPHAYIAQASASRVRKNLAVDPTPAQTAAMARHRANDPLLDALVYSTRPRAKPQLGAAPWQPWNEMPPGYTIEEIERLTTRILTGTEDDSVQGRRQSMQSPVESDIYDRCTRVRACDGLQSEVPERKRPCFRAPPSLMWEEDLEEFRRFMSEI